MDLNTNVGSKSVRKASKKKPIIIVIIVLLIAAAVISGINFYKGKTAKEGAPRLNTAIARRGNLSVVVSGSGPISSSEKFTLTSNVSGTLTKVYFKDGDKVKAGDLIFEIDDKDTKLKIKQLKNSIALAQLTHSSNVKDLEASTITAPINGEILNLQVKEGDSISNNGTLLTITDKSKLKLLVPFNNTYRDRLTVGQKVTVNVYDTGRDELHVVEGSISSISTPSYTTGDGNEVYNVGVTVDNTASLSEGMTANITVKIDGKELTSKGSSTLSYLRSITVKASSGGTVSKLYVENGQNVREGEILAELENEDLKLTIETSSLKLEDLYSELQTAEEKLLDYKIYAPFDGTLTLNDIEQGNSIKQGDVLGNVANYDTMEFNINVDELDIAKIQTGQSARVTIDALPETSEAPLAGTVTKIAVEGTSSNGVSTYPVTIQIEENAALKGSMSANGEIIVNEKNDVIYVPVDAVKKRNGKSYVSVVKGPKVPGSPDKKMKAGPKPEGNSDGGGDIPKQQDTEQKVEMREVTTGISTAEYIEIVSGLKEGEAVIVDSSSSRTNNGQRRQDMMFMGPPPAGGGGSVRVRAN